MTTITDVYHYFTELFGNEFPTRTQAELQGLIHNAGLRYEEIGESFWDMAFGDPDANESWAHGTINEPTVAQWDVFRVAQAEAD